MNEPASFVAGRPGPNGENLRLEGCPNNDLNRPPFIPASLKEGQSGILFEKTICMDGEQTNPLTGETEKHYDMHSLYGYSEGQPTLDACEEVTGHRCIGKLKPFLNFTSVDYTDIAHLRLLDKFLILLKCNKSED